MRKTVKNVFVRKMDNNGVKYRLLLSLRLRPIFFYSQPQSNKCLHSHELQLTKIQNVSKTAGKC